MRARIAWSLAAGHIAAIALAVAGITIALPNPDLWAGDAVAERVYEFGMRHGGVVQIWLGFGAMVVSGSLVIGWRRTAVFAVVAMSTSLAVELVGTATGWPFGRYAYMDGLGAKILGRVPYTIPMSWFSMGLASYLLGVAFVRALGKPRPGLAGVAAGAALLVAWDLLLDPAMAHDDLPARFWVWLEGGPYFGMPAQNLAGWTATGFAFMGVARLAWHGDPPTERYLGVPLSIYIANLLFAGALAATAVTWLPIAVLPWMLAVATWGWVATAPRTLRGVSRRALRATARLGARRLRLHLSSTWSLPPEGPALIAARHAHHLYDGVALLAALPRFPVILVGLDWAGVGVRRAMMEVLCALVGWPVIDRPTDGRRVKGLRTGLESAVEALVEGEVVVVFPEGYPQVDPHRREPTVHPSSTRRGTIWIARRAAERLGRPVPVLPLGIVYREEGASPIVALRFGTELGVTGESDDRALIREVETAIRQLSRDDIAACLKGGEDAATGKL